MTVKTHTSHCIRHISTVKITVFTFFSVFLFINFLLFRKQESKKNYSINVCLGVCAEVTVKLKMQL